MTTSPPPEETFAAWRDRHGIGPLQAVFAPGDAPPLKRSRETYRAGQHLCQLAHTPCGQALAVAWHDRTLVVFGHLEALWQLGEAGAHGGASPGAFLLPGVLVGLGAFLHGQLRGEPPRSLAGLLGAALPGLVGSLPLYFAMRRERAGAPGHSRGREP